ncbi:DUF4315 family protein [Lactococcus lactis]|uniref:DUF4315 family protein n=1 Tax=Lactococcus lactis TaxID=1358 RepID=UPI00288CA301|nr:DUF4315 family protein [Lactococcus lactis]MDT2935507.1 DUF4315 family protein [Lactococcus lactis]
MTTVEKIRSDIEKAKAKIAEQQKKVRDLEARISEEENLEIVRMVKAVKLERGELAAFLKAYASGEIALPTTNTEEENDDEA